MKATAWPLPVDPTKLPAIGPLLGVPVVPLVPVVALPGATVDVDEDRSVLALVDPVPVLPVSDALLSVVVAVAEPAPGTRVFGCVKEPDHCMPANVDW